MAHLLNVARHKHTPKGSESLNPNQHQQVQGEHQQEHTHY